MRFYILRALLRKEVRRHLMNRGGLALGGLLIGMALMLSVFDPTAAGGVGAAGGGEGAAETGGLVGGVHHCYLFHSGNPPLVGYLRNRIPPELRTAVLVRAATPAEVERSVNETPGVGSIYVRSGPGSGGRSRLEVEVWHPAGNPGAMAGYEAWFWKEVRLWFQAEAAAKVKAAGADPAGLPAPKFEDEDYWAVLETYRDVGARADELREAAGQPSAGLPEVTVRRVGQTAQPIDLRSAVATAMVVFALYFSCVYLLPTLTCEERERGVLLAQALSPASPAEILTAKFLFYPTLGVALAATLTGIYKPAVLGSLFYWLAVFTVACGFLGVGMTVATLAKTQRGAFLGSMCYLLSVALILMFCQRTGLPVVPYLVLEYHSPRVLRAAIIGEVHAAQWQSLLATAALAASWVWAAGILFRRRGWQ